MIKNEDIICISSIDWDFLWQGHQEIMSRLAANGNRVLFIENTGVRAPNLRDLPRLKNRIRNWLNSVKGIRKERENLYVYSPIILPFPYSRIARWINKKLIISHLDQWIKSIGFSNPIIWTFLPTGLAIDVIDSIENKLVIYYCIDNLSASSEYAKRIQKTERQLLKKADMVFVTANNLYNTCREYNKEVYIFPFGVNLKLYEKARVDAAPVPDDISKINRTIIGYMGGIHKWIDFDLIKFLAKDHEDKALVFIGPMQTDARDGLRGLSNIHFLGQKEREELPSYINNFDVCIIPYLITDYTKNVYPTKLTEYLSLGKPVVSTAIPEVVAFSERHRQVVDIARSYADFSSLVKKALEKKDAADLIAERRSVAVSEGSWDDKIEKMSSLISERLKLKESQRAFYWKDNLLRLYKKSRKRTVPVAAAVLLLYLGLFHTPLIWLIGKPLKVSSPLQKADAIIVLGGGVGESGKPGRSHEERASYAIDLFKEGYAPHVIFSSGARYIFEEARVMEAIAVSMGVPKMAIILEEKASNTYENIKYTNDIMLKHHWAKAIIISSPYNMRRVSLVCRSAAPDIDFIYAPIPRSAFFGDEDGVMFKHIGAIVHEYVAILYYMLKGYI